MSEKEQLEELIDKPCQPNDQEWAVNVESFLRSIHEDNERFNELLHGIETQGYDFIGRGNTVLALLKELYHSKYEHIELPLIKKRNQVFVAMRFDEQREKLYQDAIIPAVHAVNLSCTKVNDEDYDGLIIEKIKDDISDSLFLIADLTGNRGGVYYEAGIARGLQMCNHPIKLIFTCEKEFFEKEKVHFDVQGDNILLYDSANDYKEKLICRINGLLKA